MAPRVLLDTNVWRMLVDSDQILDLRSRVKTGRLDALVAPAVVYEMFRNPSAETRRRQVKAVTLGSWTRLMPELFDECAETRELLRHHRAQWLRRSPDLRSFHRLRADWSGGGGFWRRARKTPDLEMATLRLLEGQTLDLARTEAHQRRDQLSPLQFDSIKLNDLRASPIRHIPGWRGDQVEPWRLDAARWWWRSLITAPEPAVLDWLEPFLDLGAIAKGREDWNRMWLYEVRRTEAPREWMRWAVSFLQGLRKVTAGTPVDNQIALYAYDAGLFLTGDKALVDIINKVGASAPRPTAKAHRIFAGADPVGQIDSVLQRTAATA